MRGNAEVTDLPRREAEPLEPAEPSRRPPVRIDSLQRLQQPSSGSAAATFASELPPQIAQNPDAGQNSSIAHSGNSKKVPPARRRWKFRMVLREARRKNKKKREPEQVGRSSVEEDSATRTGGGATGLPLTRPGQQNSVAEDKVPHGRQRFLVQGEGRRSYKNSQDGLPVTRSGQQNSVAEDKVPHGRQRFLVQGEGRRNDRNSEDVSSARTARTNTVFDGDGQANAMQQSRLQLIEPSSLHHSEVIGSDGEEESVVRPGSFAVSPGLPVIRPYSSFVMSQSDAHSSTRSLENPSVISRLSSINTTRDGGKKIPRRMLCVIGIVLLFVLSVSIGVGVAVSGGGGEEDEPVAAVSSSVPSASPTVCEFDGLGFSGAVLSCQCFGTVVVTQEVTQKYMELKTTLASALGPDFTSTPDSCDRQNTALYWLAEDVIAEPANNQSLHTRYGLVNFFLAFSNRGRTANLDLARWNDRSGWLSTQSECDWFGVYCSNGLVTAIRFTRNGLEGTIPSELSTISSLGQCLTDLEVDQCCFSHHCLACAQRN